jgi:hypothetical protein
MNADEEKQLEERMRSWTPRRPSRGLERRVFGDVSKGGHSFRLPRWSWLAPAASVCVLLVQLAVHQPSSGFSPATMAPGAFATSSLNDRDLSAYAPGWVHSDRNGPIRDTFEWTNATVAPSTMRTSPVMLSLTNSLFD